MSEPNTPRSTADLLALTRAQMQQTAPTSEGSATPTEGTPSLIELVKAMQAQPESLSAATPFTERVVGAVPGLVSPSPRTVEGPTKKSIPQPTGSAVPLSAFEEAPFVAPAPGAGTSPFGTAQPSTASGTGMSPFGAAQPTSARSSAPAPVSSTESVAPPVAPNVGGASPFGFVQPTVVSERLGGTPTASSPALTGMAETTHVERSPSAQPTGGASPFGFVQPTEVTESLISPSTEQAPPPASDTQVQEEVSEERPQEPQTTEEEAPVESDERAPSTPASVPTGGNSPFAIRGGNSLWTPEETVSSAPTFSSDTYVPQGEDTAEPTASEILSLEVEPVTTAPRSAGGQTEFRSPFAVSPDLSSADAEEDAFLLSLHRPSTAAAEPSVRASDEDVLATDDSEALFASVQEVERREVVDYAPTDTRGGDTMAEDPLLSDHDPYLDPPQTYTYPSPALHYDTPDEMPTYEKALRGSVTRATLRLLCVLLLCAGATVLWFHRELGLALPKLLDPAVYPMIYCMADMELLLLGMVCCLPFFLDGLSDALHGNATLYALLSVPTLLYLCTRVASVTYESIALGAPRADLIGYTPVFLFGFVLLSLGKFLELRHKKLVFDRVSTGAFEYVTEAEPNGRARLFAVTHPSCVTAHMEQTLPTPSGQNTLLILGLLAAVGAAVLGYFQGDSVSAALDGFSLALAACFSLGGVAAKTIRTFVRTKRNLTSLGACALSEADECNLRSTDTLVLGEDTLFARSSTYTRIDAYWDEGPLVPYLLRAVGDAVGGSLKYAIESYFKSERVTPRRAGSVVRSRVEEDGMELLVDGEYKLQVGITTYMQRLSLPNVRYTPKDARLEQARKAQILFVARDQSVFAKFQLFLQPQESIRDALSTLFSTGKQVIVETGSPFFGETELLHVVREENAPIKVDLSRSTLCAPPPSLGHGGILSSTPTGAVSLLARLTKDPPRKGARILSSLFSFLLGAGCTAAILLVPQVAPFALPILAGVQLLRLCF